MDNIYMTRQKNPISDEKFSGAKRRKSQSFVITNFRCLFFFEEEYGSKNLKEINSEKLQVSHQQDHKNVKSPVQQAA